MTILGRSLSRCRCLLAQPRTFATVGSNQRSHYTTLAAISLVSLSIGFAAGRSQSVHHEPEHVLPNGLPRTCCEDNLTEEQKTLPKKLARIVGKANVIDGRDDTTATLPFLKGARLGQGHALAIVTPERLQDVVDVVEAAVAAGCVVLPQGQNTGLTGGSVPHTSGERPVVVVSMKKLNRIFPIDGGKRVVCLAGVGLAELQQFLAQYFPDRESHSQLGSTFLNPTTAAGVAFGSGGTQLRKGPAYTERALYLKIATNKWREAVVEIVNTLGVNGMHDKDLPPDRARKMDSVAYRLDTWSRWIADGYERDMKYSLPGVTAAASDIDYKQRICKHNREASRFNADTRGPDLCRSEGKVVILATVHDTFPKPLATKTFWLSFDSLETALAFRQQVCLDNPNDLPVSCEYVDKDAFEVIDRSGRLMATSIKFLGPASPMVRRLWSIKLWVESLPLPGASTVADKFMYHINPLIPSVLPSDVRKSAEKFDHHVQLTVGEFGDGNLERLLDRLQQFASKHGRDKVTIHDCSSAVAALTAFRFVAASAFRTWCIGTGNQGISVDYALPKNDGRAPPVDAADAKPLKRMRYSHFGCNVVHEDLAYAPGVDVHQAKHDLKATVEFECGGKLPAEHGHGTEYIAPPETQERWRRMDPLNVLNPGVGGLSEKSLYKD